LRRFAYCGGTALQTSGQRLAIQTGSIAIALISVLGLSLKVYWDAQYGSYQQRKTTHQQHRQTVEKRAQKIKRVFDAVVFTNTTPQQISAQLTPPTRVTTISKQNAGGQRLWIGDATLGTGMILSYDGQGMIQGGSCCGALNNQTYPGPPLPSRKPIESHFQSLWHLLVPRFTGINLPWTTLIWFGIIIAAWRSPTYRPTLLAGSFWIVALTALALNMAPQHRLTDIMSNDPMFWVVIMLLCSIAAIILNRIEHRPDPRACTACGYNLIGNTSGTCPECGQGISENQMNLLERTKNTSTGG